MSSCRPAVVRVIGGRWQLGAPTGREAGVRHPAVVVMAQRILDASPSVIHVGECRISSRCVRSIGGSASSVSAWAVLARRMWWLVVLSRGKWVGCLRVAVGRVDVATFGHDRVMDLCDVATEQLEAELVAHAAWESRGLARFLDVLVEYDRRQAWGSWGCVSVQHWLSWKCGLATVAASERLRVAKAVQGLPLVKRSFWDGHLSYSKVRELTRVVTLETELRGAKWPGISLPGSWRSSSLRAVSRPVRTLGETGQLGCGLKVGEVQARGHGAIVAARLRAVERIDDTRLRTHDPSSTNTSEGDTGGR